MRAVFALSLALVVCLVADASAAGTGGWDHLGDGGTPGTSSLNGAVYALDTVAPGALYAGGNFTSAGGNAAAAHIARWDGTSWSEIGAPVLNGDVHAIAYYAGKLYVGGTFTDAGGNPNADFLAVWDGVSWQPFCNASGPAFSGSVAALQVIGSTLYVGGSFQNGAGIASADYLLACDLTTGASSSTVPSDGDISGGVYALTSDSGGRLYAGGQFINMAGIAAADHVASYDGSWHAMGAGGGPGGGAVDDYVRSIASRGSDVYIGTDSVNVAGIPQADHVARWDGSAWSAVGANAAGTDGWLPASAFIYALAASGSKLDVAGSFQNADGNATADDVAEFDGTAWKPLGSDGAGNGPWTGNGLALAFFGDQVVAGGNFTSAGGDTHASYAARYPAPFTTAVAVPPPVLGQTASVVPEKGVVLIKLPPGASARASGLSPAAASGFIPLTAAKSVPLGSTLDTTRGQVGLLTAANRTGATQSGHFSQGVFVVQQGKTNPLTTLSMTGGNLGSCSKLPPGGAARLTAARKGGRSLFSDVHGRFRTRGRNSAATVRGTAFLVKDACAGTLTTVSRGTVTVRDFTLRKNVTVKAHHKYLARPPKRH